MTTTVTLTESVMSYSHEISFILCSLIGGMMHYTKKFLRKETDVSMAQWFGKSNWVATVYTIVMFIFITIGALAGGVINEKTDFWAVLYTGFVTGFAVDAGFNSDKNITQSLTEVKADTRELFEKDEEDDKPVKTARNDMPNRNPQLDDEEVVAMADTDKKRRQGPVEGSPKVPPKRIA
jgi:hypothetical protein